MHYRHKRNVDSFQDGLESLGKTSKVKLYRPDDIRENQLKYPKRSKLPKLSSAQLAAPQQKTPEELTSKQEAQRLNELIKHETNIEYQTAYAKLEQAIREYIKEQIPLTDRRVVGYRRPPKKKKRRWRYCNYLFKYREADAVSKKFGKLRVIFEFKFWRNDQYAEVSKKVARAKIQLYQTGGLLLKVPKTNISGCLLVISDNSNLENFTPLEHINWKEIRTNKNQISQISLSKRAAFKIAKSRGILITPYEQTLIRTAFSGIPDEDVEKKETMENLILPSIRESFRDLPRIVLEKSTNK